MKMSEVYYKKEYKEIRKGIYDLLCSTEDKNIIADNIMLFMKDNRDILFDLTGYEK